MSTRSSPTLSACCFELGSEHVEAINAVSGDRCNPHPHVYSDRLLRPGDQAFFDIIHSFMGYRTCYYRTFCIGGATSAQLDAYKQCREWLEAAIELARPGVTTDQIAAVWPTAQELGFPDEESCFGLQFGHGLGVGLYEAPMISRLHSFDDPVELEEGMVFALETYCPASDGRSAARIEEEVVVRARRAGGDHALSRRRAARRRPPVRSRRRPRRCRRGGRGGMSSSTAAPSAADLELGLELYRRMRLIRRFEDTIQSLFQKGEVHGTTHLYSGEEAVAVGVASVLGDADRVAGTYRGHGHALALGVDPQALLDEMLGRATGVCGGRSGSMNVIDLEHRLIGCFGIIGGSIAAATGAALSLRRTGGVAVAFFGDGTTNHGYFHECLNFAQVNRLPVVYVCENNLYGEFTPWEDVTAGQILARPQALEIPASQVDGNDVWAVRAAAADAVEHARSGHGPSFIEALTYRFVGHSRSDPGVYRKPGEMDAWKQRDPLKLGRAALVERLGAGEGAVDAVDDEVEALIAGIVERGLGAPYPTPGPAREFKD